MIDIIQFDVTDADKEFIKTLGYNEVYNIDSLKRVKITFGGDDAVNRKAVEQNGGILLNPHNTRTKDYMHFRNSGLNHILCNLATQHGVIIGFTLDKMYEPNDLGRVIQSLKLCRKYKCKIGIFSLAKNRLEMRSVSDIISFLTVVGFDTQQIKQITELKF